MLTIEKQMEETTEIRKMDAALKFELVNLLDIGDGWKSIMTRATVDCDLTKIRKYTIEHVKYDFIILIYIIVVKLII